MNILQVHKYYWYKDGATNYMLDLSDKLEDAGHTVIPFSMKNPKNINSPYSRFFVSKMDINNPKELSFTKKLSFAGRIFYSIEAKENLEKLLQKADIDIAHIHNIYHHISPSILPALKKHGIPIVMTLHDYKLICPNYSLFHHGKNREEDCTGWYGSCVRGKCMKNSRLYSRLVQLEMIFHHKIMKYYERYVDTFIAPSQFMIDICVKYGWSREKFVHIKNPVDIKKFPLSKNIGDKVTYIGRLSEEKGLDILLDSAKKTPSIPYTIVGTGPEEKYLKARTKKEKIQNITFVGFQTGKSLDKFYDDSRLIIVPSIWYENYPLSILEAKSKGKIVIGSDIGGIPELISKEFLFKPKDSNNLAEQIKKWYGQPSQKLISLGSKLHKEVEKNNSIKSHITTIENLYETLVSQ